MWRRSARQQPARGDRAARSPPLARRKETTVVSDPKNQTAAQRALGNFAPKLVGLTDDVLFRDVWQRGN
jgi:hypothetical protein